MNWKFWKKNDESAEMALMRARLNQTQDKLRIQASAHSINTFSKPFDGEKNLGELGPAIMYEPWYNVLSIRSWQAYTESEIAQTIIDKYCKWIIDKGLKLNAVPNRSYLSMHGYNFSTTEMERFNKSVEACWNVWASSKRSTHKGENNLHQETKEVFKSCKIGGDVLVVLRFDGKNITVDAIDGSSVCTPYTMSTDKRLSDGVEVDEKGSVVRYHIKESDGRYKTIEAYNSFGIRQAFLVKGQRYRLDTRRGLPVVAVSLETLKKLERYKEAAVGSAEERQKIVMYITHGANSDNLNPYQDQVVKAISGDYGADIPEDDYGTAMADNIAVTTNKSVFNLQDAELKSVSSDQEMFFKEFYSTNADIICGAFGIPPNVAFSIYNDSFSASRAATKDWDHTIQVVRDEFQEQYYQRIYDYFLFVQVLTGKVQAPGYLQAFAKDDFMMLEAYNSSRFTGPFFPHIDPVKEVNAERAKLGEKFKDAPLTTLESATERVGDGDVSDNLQQTSEELADAERLGLISNEEPEETPPAED